MMGFILAGAFLAGCGSKPAPPILQGNDGGGGAGGGGVPPPAVGEGVWKTRETVILTPERAKLVVPKSFRVSPDGRRFAYVLSQSGGHVAVIDQTEFPTVFEQVADVRFSGDGKDVAIAGRLPAARAFAEPQPVVVLNGKTILPQFSNGFSVLKAEAPELLAVADGRVLYTADTTHTGRFTFADGERLAPRESFDGPRAVVVKLKGQAAFARRDVQRTVWDQAGTPDAIISPNGAAWAAISDSRDVPGRDVSIDGEVRKKFPVAHGFAFSPDGKRHAYFAARPETKKSYLVVDGTLTENLGGKGVGFVFSPDGSRWAAQTATRVIVDGTPHKWYSAVPEKAQDVPAVAFSPDGKHVAYLARQLNRTGPDGKDVFDPHAFLVVDGNEVKEWAAVGADVFWAADNRTVGYVATPKGKAAVVVVGDKEWPAFDETTPLGFGPDGRS
ncbi:MAG TPA: hypothetical protein VMZ71_01195, partial [Gemmataceae bacterium]|nr:hypothetical protein [Gemmataceae bacterium]